MSKLFDRPAYEILIDDNCQESLIVTPFGDWPTSREEVFHELVSYLVPIFEQYRVRTVRPSEYGKIGLIATGGRDLARLSNRIEPEVLKLCVGINANQGQ